jgi:acetolactate synthase-1/2/3 large subunit
VSQRSPGDPEGLQKAIELLSGAQRSVILAGQGALLSEATPELTAFAQLMRIPVVTSPNGKGAIDERHELAFGASGRNASYAANEACKNADVILALGCSFDDRATSAWLPGYTFSIPPTSLIQVDIDSSEIGRNYPVYLGIVADVKACLGALARLAEGKSAGARTARMDQWLGKLNDCRDIWNKYQDPLAQSDQTPIRPERLVKGLSRVIPENAIVATDVGVHHNWLVQLWQARKPRHFLQSWGFAAMGFAASGILGAKLAAPDQPAIAVVGDGSFLMTPHILGTAVEYDIPAVWVIWNNYGYTSIRDIQLGNFKRELATSFRRQKTGEPYSPDFAMLARSFGVDSATVEKAGDLEGAIEHAIRADKPYLVEVRVERDILPVATGSWSLPPLPHPEPNFEQKALGK